MNYSEELKKLSRMTKQNKETHLDLLARQLLLLAEDSEETQETVFLLNKFNTVYIGGNKYTLKLQRED